MTEELNQKPKSNYYLFGTTAPDQAKAYVPQKIDPADAKQPAATTAGISSWNSSGTTWEDRDVSEWAKKELTATLAKCSSDYEVTVTSVEGDASIVYTRGKPRIGFELTIKGSFKKASKSLDFEISNLDETTLQDEEYELSFSGDSAAKASLKPAFKKCLANFVVEMKKQ